MSLVDCMQAVDLPLVTGAKNDLPGRNINSEEDDRSEQSIGSKGASIVTSKHRTETWTDTHRTAQDYHHSPLTSS